MAIISIDKKLFEKEIGKLDEKMQERISMFGTPVEAVTDTELQLEIFANRPDMLSYQGFKRAFLTIVDTHVTTVVSALFLGLFGTGPVRGFAITLVIGLLANLFTSVYVSRVIFDWHLHKMPREAELSI